MGIPGLLGALKSVTYPVHLSSYRGLTAGVDAYCWLHRGAFSCGTELCTGVATDRYVAFCMKRVNLLLHHGIQPIVVFDGASLPMKRNRNSERRRQRESARSKGEAAMAAGEAGAAGHHFSKAVGVTHDMAFQFIKALRQAGIRLIVAPYEADAQLAFLSRTGAVDVVITEDSDCLPYGCKKVLFKMDNEGHGQEIQLRNLAANTPLSLCNWKNSMFLDLCLLVGCDYITSSIKGLGITTAHRLVHSHRSLDKIMRAVNSSKFVVPEGYWEQYKMARVTFRHHIIYNPETETTMHLMPLGDTAKQLTNLDFLGDHLQPRVAQGVSNGYLLPTNHQPYETAAPPAETEAYPHPPPHEAKTSVQVVASTHPRMEAAAAVGNSDVSGGRPWDLGVEPASEKNGEFEGDPVPLAETPLSRAFIDNPFRARRRALKEVPPASPAGVGWGAASAYTAATWATQGNHRGRASESTGIWGARLQTDDMFSGNSFPQGDTSVYPGMEETRDTPSFRSRGEETLWPFGSRPEDEDGDGGGLAVDWRKGRAAENLGAQARATAGGSSSFGGLGWGQANEGVDLGKPVPGEGGEEEEETGARQTNRHPDVGVLPTQEGWTSRGFGGCEVQGGGALALVGEPNDADQAKFVPASAHHFQSTQVSQRLETLQRRKRRLNSSEGATDRPELQSRRQPREAHSDDGYEKDLEGEAAWMVQSVESETAHESKGISFFRVGKGSSHDPPVSLARQSPTSPSRRLRERNRVDNSEARVLTASSRRWTLPSTAIGVPPANGVELPLLRLLGGQGRTGGTGVSQPLPKRTRGTEFWDAQLLR